MRHTTHEPRPLSSAARASWITRRRLPLAAALLVLLSANTASADFIHDIALRAFLGFRVFNTDSALGDQPVDGTAISNSAVLGIRAEYEVLPWVAVEGEIPATITDSRDDLAKLFFVDPRAHVRVTLPGFLPNVAKPFVTAGVGLPIVLSDNQSGLESDITGEFYGGLAVAIEPKVGSLGVRLDARMAALQARGDRALTQEFEMLLTVYRVANNRWDRKVTATFDVDEDVVVEPVLDSDNDGLPDDRDACPTRPEDFDKFEDADGCPDIDNDFDRVLDIADQCPNERELLNGFQDEDGCADEVPAELIRLEGILGVTFASGTDRLTGASVSVLRGVALVLKRHPSVSIEVSGHTDDRGDETANQALSQKRAERVVEFLTRQGIDKNRLRAVGFGPFNPIADNASAAGRLKNRRVELQIIRPKIQKPKQ